MKDQKFKVGDKVTILSWHFAEIRTPQKGIIVEIDSLDKDTPYAIEIEEDHNGNSSAWFFSEGEFELVGANKPDFVVEDKPDFNIWLYEKITLFTQLDTDTSKLQEVKRIYNLYLNSLK